MTQSKNDSLRPGEVIMASAFTNQLRTRVPCRAIGESEMRREGFVLPTGFGWCKPLLEENDGRVCPEILVPSRPNTTLNFGNMFWAPKLVTVKGLFALRGAILVKNRRIRAKRLRKAKQRRK